MLRRAFLVLEPDTDHVLARAPLCVLGIAKPDDRPALRADEILGRDADRPAEPPRLRDDLVERVHRPRPPDARNRLHVGRILEQLHAERDRPEFQEAFEITGDFRPVESRLESSIGGHGASNIVVRTSALA